MQSRTQEPNPFAEEKGADEWSRLIEQETGTVRVDLVPLMISTWIKKIDPKIVVDVGSGQGALAEYAQLGNAEYIGIEPSLHLTERAREIHPKEGRQFVVGNAYALPIASNLADAAFSVNVWFHLADLDTATSELARILRTGGRSMICTANPDAYDLWLSMFDNPDVDDTKIDGRLNIPGSSGFTRNILFKHSTQEILAAFAKHGLIVNKTEFPKISESERSLFVVFFGHKA